MVHFSSIKFFKFAEQKGIDVNSNVYLKLTSSVSIAEHKHSTSINGVNFSQTEKYKYIYDDELRLIRREYSSGNLPLQVVEFTYDDLGQLKVKELKEVSTLRQSINYKNNIRGWLTELFNDFMKERHNTFEEAVLTGDLLKVKLLLNGITDINTKDQYGRTILYYAILKGYTDIVSELCLSNIEVNTQDKNGKSPLHVAAIYYQLEIAKTLIRHSANIDIKDNNGNTPLFDAVFHSEGRRELILLLLQSGADPILKNNYAISPKSLAESISNFDVTDLFL